MDLPNEVTLMILEYLPKRDLKKARLVCKDLALFGASILVGTLYISPRETDMAVFDAITQHPTIRHSVRHIFYDTAQFKKENPRQYLNRLHLQLIGPAYAGLREVNVEVRRLIEHIEESAHCSLENFQRTTKTKAIIRQCGRFPAISDGFQQYALLADQQNLTLSQSWFSRVVHGLKATRQIDSVIIGNSFDTRNAPHLRNGLSQKIVQINEVDDGDHGRYNPWYGINRAFRTGRTSPIMLSSADIVNGRRSVGSPVARQWPFTSLQPASTRLHKRAKAVKPEEAIPRGRSDGSREFTQLIQLLAITEKQPAFFGVMASSRFSGGLPLLIFSDDTPGQTQSLGELEKLKVLRLKFGRGPLEHTAPRKFPHLKPIFQDRLILEELTLHLPFCPNSQYPIRNNFPQVFPPVAEWRLWKLHSFSLYGMSISYRDLVGILFLGLQSLKHLRLGAIRLVDGSWEDIIEGLRYAKALSSCEFSTGLFVESELESTRSIAANNPQQLEDLAKYILKERDHPLASYRFVPKSFSEGSERFHATLHELRLSYERERR